MRRLGVGERRRRLGLRHHLAPSARADGAVQAAGDLVGLHGTDPASVFLAASARTKSGEIGEVERALYEERALVRMLGMRRTMFVVPLDLAPIVQAACTRAVAVRERRRLIQIIESAGTPPIPAGGSSGSKRRPTRRSQLAAKRSRRSWQRMCRGPLEAARVELARRWLAAFGPGTVADLRWWTGWTAGEVKRALTEIASCEVDLEGETGLALTDDVAPSPSSEPWAALLPALDPTVMGWSQRSWYLGNHGAALFDRSGNAGPTVWWSGRIVGGWAQRKDGEITFRLLEDVGADAVAAVEDAATAMAARLGSTRVTPRWRTPLERELTA